MATEDDIKLVQKLNSLKSDELALNKELRGLSKEQLDTLTKINGVEDEIANKAKLLLETKRSTVDYAVARFGQTARRRPRAQSNAARAAAARDARKERRRY